jgi:hypothetical protein
MVMNLLRITHRPNPQYLAGSVREIKCTCLGYRTKLSSLHTLDRPLALAFSRGGHSATRDPEQENNQETPGRS